MRVYVENSTWNNIGDAFYQIPLLKFLKEVFPDWKVYSSEGPIYRAFRPKRFSSNAFPMMDYNLNADLFVFSGPMLGALTTHYTHLIKKIVEQGKKYALISVAGHPVNQQKEDEIKRFLQEYPPVVFATRDEATYHRFKGVIDNPYNGICTSFLLSRLDIPKYEPGFKYVISSFYTRPEPKFSLTASPKVENLSLEDRSPLLPLHNSYARLFEYFRKYDSHLADMKIIRTRQDIGIKFNRVKFAHPNSFLSYNPYSYFSLYKGAEFTISERIHACAATVALGRPAKLVSKSPRKGIYSRMGVDLEKNNGVIYPFPEVIQEETRNLQNYLSTSLANIEGVSLAYK